MTDVSITADESWELALYRALKWESAPFIRAVVWANGSPGVRLEVFCDAAAFNTQEWLEEVEAEAQQSVPTGGPPMPLLECFFRPAEEFNPTSTAPPKRVLHVNEYFKTA